MTFPGSASDGTSSNDDGSASATSSTSSSNDGSDSGSANSSDDGSDSTSRNDEPTAPPHVIVVGGGIAGLVAARDLVDARVRVTLLEASDRLGGKVTSHVVGGVRLDAGAESFATRRGTVAQLVTELGLASSLVVPSASGAWLQPRTGEALPLPKGGLLGIPSVPLARDVIAVVGLPGALRAQLDSLLSGFAGSRERSLGRLVRRRMGRAVLDRLVTPVAGAVHSAHPDSLDVDLVAPHLRAAVLSEGSLAKAVLTLREAAPAGSAVQGLRGGLFRITEAIAKQLEGRAEVRLASPVAQLWPDAVVLDDGSRLTADRVVSTVPIGPIGLGAPRTGAGGVPITIATLVVRSADLDSAPRGTGVLVAPGAAGISAKAITHSTAKWAWLAESTEGRHVLRLSYEAAPDSDDRLIEVARTDASRLLGVHLPPDAVEAFDRVRWTGPAAADSPVRHGTAGRAATASASTADHDAPAVPGVVYIGERESGTGLAAVIALARSRSRALLEDLGVAPGLRLTES